MRVVDFRDDGGWRERTDWKNTLGHRRVREIFRDMGQAFPGDGAPSSGGRVTGARRGPARTPESSMKGGSFRNEFYNPIPQARAAAEAEAAAPTMADMWAQEEPAAPKARSIFPSIRNRRGAVGAFGMDEPGAMGPTGEMTGGAGPLAREQLPMGSHADGEPVVGHHGTRAEFGDDFDYSTPAWFATDEATAKTYASSGGDHDASGPERLVTKGIAPKKLLDLGHLDSGASLTPQEFQEKTGVDISKLQYSPDVPYAMHEYLNDDLVADQMRKQGYDAVRVKERGKDTYGVLAPSAMRDPAAPSSAPDAGPDLPFEAAPSQGTRLNIDVSREMAGPDAKVVRETAKRRVIRRPWGGAADRCAQGARAQVHAAAVEKIKADITQQIGSPENVAKELTEQTGLGTGDTEGWGWYRQSIAEMERLATEQEPELKDPSNMGLFKLILAARSPGSDPVGNARAALDIWRRWKGGADLGEWIETRSGEAVRERLRSTAPGVHGSISASGSGDQAMGRVAELLEHYTEEADGNHAEAVKNLIHDLQQQSGGEDGYLGAGRGKHGIYDILGRKTGSFWLNMMGHGDPVTADMWAVRQARRALGYTVEAVDRHTGKWGLDSAPKDPEYDAIEDAYTQIAQELSNNPALKKAGVTVSPMDVQARLWYAEKNRWTDAGAPFSGNDGFHHGVAKYYENPTPVLDEAQGDLALRKTENKAQVEGGESIISDMTDEEALRRINAPRNAALTGGRISPMWPARGTPGEVVGRRHRTHGRIRCRCRCGSQHPGPARSRAAWAGAAVRLEEFGRKGIITIYGMTLCAVLAVLHVDIAVITCIAGMVAVYNGADAAVERGQSGARKAEAEAASSVSQESLMRLRLTQEHQAITRPTYSLDDERGQ